MSSLRVRYQTIEYGDVDIHLRTLRDRQQFDDEDGAAESLGVSPASWPLFGVVWDSSAILSRLMSDYDISGKRILEVGCGIGLSSLVLNQRNADITATDYNPEAERFLKMNVSLNHGREIPFIRTGWGDLDTGIGEFDLIIGSDLLYEPDHVELLSGFIQQHACATSEVILVDPGRGLYAPFTRKMISYGYDYQHEQISTVDYLAKPFNGHLLTFHR
jgi:predicted nicotinamide N-methyase